MRKTVDGKELSELLGVSRRQAGHIINEVNRRLAEQGYITLKTRPPRAPLDKINEYLGIGGKKNAKHGKSTQQDRQQSRQQ